MTVIPLKRTVIELWPWNLDNQSFDHECCRLQRCTRMRWGGGGGGGVRQKTFWYRGYKKIFGMNYWKKKNSVNMTVIQFSTFYIQKLVTKFFRFWVSFTFWPLFSSSSKFQTFLFFRVYQLPIIPLISTTFERTLSDLFLQRNRPFRTCGKLWRTCGELWLYFEMQRRLDLWSFSWLPQRSREAKNQLSFRLWIGRTITVPIDPRR